mgnify:CR=1 FL=1
MAHRGGFFLPPQNCAELEQGIIALPRHRSLSYVLHSKWIGSDNQFVQTAQNFKNNQNMKPIIKI